MRPWAAEDAASIGVHVVAGVGLAMIAMGWSVAALKGGLVLSLFTMVVTMASVAAHKAVSRPVRPGFDACAATRAVLDTMAQAGDRYLTCARPLSVDESGCVVVVDYPSSGEELCRGRVSGPASAERLASMAVWLVDKMSRREDVG